jgi:two-component system nitrogen regulation response regulator GlnG
VRVIAATHQNLDERVRQGSFREDLFHRLNVIRLRLPPLRERREDIPMLARYFLARSARELGVEPKRITDAALAVLARFDFPGNVRQLENLCHWLTVMAPAQAIEPKDLPPELQLAPPAAGSVAGASSAAAVAPATAAPIASEAPASTLPAPAGDHAVAAPARGDAGSWPVGLGSEARALLEAGTPGVWDTLTRRFEAQLIRTALEITRGRRIEAAQKLGIGRNTITRKIQELDLDQ